MLEYVQKRVPGATQLHADMFGLLAHGMKEGIYNLRVSWKKVALWPLGVEFVLGQHELATFDYNQLTRLVLVAHENSVRLSVSPCSPRHLKFAMFQREHYTKDKPFHAHHPTIYEAIELFKFERSQWLHERKEPVHYRFSAENRELQEVCPDQVGGWSPLYLDEVVNLKNWHAAIENPTAEESATLTELSKAIMQYGHYIASLA